MEKHLQYWSILKRRGLPASIVFLTLLALSVVKTVIETPVYQAGGQLVLKKNATSSLTGVGSQLGQLESSVSGRPLATEVAVLHSLPLAEKTINTLALDIKPTEFLKSLKVKNIENTDIIEIYYTDKIPKRSVSIVNTLMKIYIENDINANRKQTKSARDFIAQQLPLSKAALQTSERRLQFFKQQHRVLDLKAEAASSASILTGLEKQVAATKSDLSSQTARMQTIQKLFGVTLQDAITASFAGESPSINAVQEQLQDLQKKIAVVGLRLTDTHPTMIDLKEQEAVLKKELEKRIEQSLISKAGRLNNLQDPDRILQLKTLGLQQELLGQYAAAEAERLSLQVRLKSLAQIIESYKQRANILPQLELQQRQLEREIAATESSYQNLLARYQELQVAENLQVSNAMIVAPALIPSVPLTTDRYINLLPGLIGGIVLGVVTALVLERLDKTIKNPKSAKDLLGYTFLGYIPPFPNGSFTPEVIVRKQPDSQISEAFRMLQTNLRFFNAEQSVKVIVVSSAVPKEGKSTIAANLAFSISQLGRDVLLVDADLRNPSQHKIWDISNQAGLSNILRSDLDVDQAVVEITPNLKVITAGQPNNNSAALLDSSQMAVFVGQVAQRYDFVIIDTSPLTVAADATILGKLVNGILFVVRPKVVDSTSISLSKEMLEKADQNVLGVAINGISANEQYSAYAATTV
ncbi:polysaccharide biosynthesis tyrosine autokinase [Anabaena sphaerica FACHB-251]|uniref:non-specific protein-tyrosine kinase n=1 Tax=Anabaena sphaerica FACHB-251 TaxID=2692883 RepID=A0A927A0Z7_9NOST|nr:polysaccharide biosynthesis tyrosine autokinase [Anabaena sphaerica]MBD2294038.1 polysaccharide biosynthesis tyrosine autokinase [Anabaena sphaerica FACHB-251]